MVGPGFLAVALHFRIRYFGSDSLCTTSLLSLKSHILLEPKLKSLPVQCPDLVRTNTALIAHKEIKHEGSRLQKGTSQKKYRSGLKMTHN